MSIINEDLIYVGLLITNNIKYMFDTLPLKNSGAFCLINELYKLPGVPIHIEDVMISLMLPISRNSICKTLYTPNLVKGQEDQMEDGVYHSEVQHQPLEEVHHHDHHQTPDYMM